MSGTIRGAIVAGGKAVRMASMCASRPKALLDVGGRPLLAHQLSLLAEAGVSDVSLFTGHQSDAIVSHLATGTPNGMRVTVTHENLPRGSGGCLSAAALDAPLVVLLGDVMIHMDLAALIAAHRRGGAEATVVVHPNDHPSDSDLVESDAGGRAIRLHRKPHPVELVARNAVVAGAFVLEPSLLARIPRTGMTDLSHDIIGGAIASGVAVQTYFTTEYLKDIGTPSRYERVLADWETGRIHASHRSQRRRAAFIDRDGTLNAHVGHLRRAEQMRLLPGAAKAVRTLNEAGILAVCVTNQPVLARAECDDLELARIHARLEMALGREHAFLDAILVCPHHPERGHAGEVSDLKKECTCRKPRTGLLDIAVRDLPIDLGRSAVFGDTWRDMELAERAGLPAFRISEQHTLDAAVATWLARTEVAC